MPQPSSTVQNNMANAALDERAFQSDMAEFAQAQDDVKLDSFISQFSNAGAAAQPAEGTTAPDAMPAITAPMPTAQPGNTVPVPTAENTPKEDVTMGVARDVAMGVMQSPREVVRGATRGVNEMLDTVGITKVRNELKYFLRLPTVQILDQEGHLAFDIKSYDQVDRNRPALPVIAKPKVETVTGKGIEAISQFMVGFKGVDKALKGIKLLAAGEKAVEGAAAATKAVEATKAAKAAKTAKTVAEQAAKGAAADVLAFDEQDKRLSNLMQEVPALQNPITEYLAANPADSFAEAKFKQAVEGLGLGAVTEGVVRGVGLMKSLRDVKGKVKPDPTGGLMVDDATAAGLDLNKQKFDFLGDPESADLILQRQVDNEVQRVGGKITRASQQTQGATPEGIVEGVKGQNALVPERKFEINFARIEGPDDIKNLMDVMANSPQLQKSLQTATRGVRDNRTTLTAATDIDGFSDLMTRRSGNAFNAEQVVAARKVYYDTTEKLMEAAKRAANPAASDIDQFNFRKMIAIHHAVQKEFLGVRAEAGRALQAWSIPVGGSGPERVKMLEQVLDEFGGPEASKDLAKRIAAAGNRLTTDQLNAITTKAWGARTLDAASEAWTLGLLTNPTTHVVNMTSNMLTALSLGGERLMAAGVKDSGIPIQEGLAYFHGLMQAQKEAFANAAKAFRTGEVGMGMGKVELPRVRATSQETLQATGFMEPFGVAMDYYGQMLSKYAGGALAAGDEYAKTMLYQAQLKALATRQAVAKGLQGQEMKKFIADTAANPSQQMRADAIQFANYGTYTKELGKTGQGIQRMIAANPGLRFIAPFIRTPVNIFKYTFERTPLAFMSKQFREDFVAGGVRGAQAKAKLGMGASIMAMGVDMSMNGQITGAGPADPKTRAALRRTGWQPYSIKIGDTYYSYARFEPLATILGMSADMSEILSNYEAYDIQQQDTVDKLGVAMVTAIGNQVVGKTFLSGFADLTELFADPARYGPQYLQRYAGSIVPAGVAAIERAIDPQMEYVFNEMDAIKSRIPGLSSQVPNKQNIWGEDIKSFYPSEKNALVATAQQAASLFNPVYYSSKRGEPIDDFMLKNGFDIDMPDKIQAFDGVKLNLRDYPQAYHDLVKLRGQDIKLPKYGNQNMKDFFNELVAGDTPRSITFFNHWTDAEEQQAFINKVVKDYNDAAKKVLLQKYPVLQQTLDEERTKQILLNENRGAQ